MKRPDEGKVILAFAITVGCVLFVGAGIALRVKSNSDAAEAAREHAAFNSRATLAPKPLPKQSPELAAELKTTIKQLMKAGAIHKIEDGKVFVHPLWYEMPFDQKQMTASVCFGYIHEVPSDKESMARFKGKALGIFDTRNNKLIATFSVSGGLNLRD